MPSFPCVHHVEVGVTDGPRAVNILRRNYTFDVVATRNSKVARQWLLEKNDTRYLVTCLTTTHKEQIQKDDFVIDWMGCHSDDVKNGEDTRPRKNSVFNICLQVDDIQQSLKKFDAYDVRPYRGLKTISDSFGSVKLCTIKSCVGDVYHTLVEKENYSGPFLPGFRQLECSCDPVKEEFWSEPHGHDVSSSCSSLKRKRHRCDNDNVIREMSEVGSENSTEDRTDVAKNKVCDTLGNGVSSSGHSMSTSNGDSDCDVPNWATFDHVAIAVEMGSSPEIIKWYENCLGMKKFRINREDDNDEGLVLSSDNANLRLRAMEYWKCAETGLTGPKQETPGNRLSMVIAEGLPPLSDAVEENQIESWMRQHGGPGIQHIALSTHDIKATVRRLKQFGTAFANAPPPAYYSQVGRLQDIQKAGEDLEALQEHGILIDTEADSIREDTGRGDDVDGDTHNHHERYLLQIFTRPVFTGDPFFMEIIQREGASGFGSGNVAALYRSVQAFIIDKAKDRH